MKSIALHDLALLTLALVLTLAASPARADLASEARFHDELAHEHYDAGRYDEALQQFFFEQRLAPNPRIVFNLGLCFERLRRIEDAFMYYTEYLASGDTDTANRTYVEAALARLGPRVARLRIESTPPGATIYLDDRAHGSYGETPRLLALAPGSHHVWLERAGHRSVELDVSSERGAERTVTASLEPILGTLHVDAPEGARVLVRDAAGATVTSGPAPLDAHLAPGPHTVEIDAEGFRPFQAIALVEADAARTVTAELEALPAPTGEITVTSSVAGAVVEIDGEAAGFAPVVLPGVRLGEHTLTVRSEGLAEWSDAVVVEPDVRTWLTVQLVPPAETTRSDWTWIAGGLSAGALAVWGTLLGVSVATYDELQSIRASGGTTGPLVRDRAMTIDVAADVMLSIGLVTLVTAVVLFFATEHTETHASTATISRQAR